MRNLYLLISIICLHVSANAQCDSTLNGSWKIAALSTGDIYFSYISDLTFISPDLNASHPDSASKSKLISSLKDIFKNHTYKFDSKGQFESSMGKNMTDTGTYCYVKETGILKLTYTNDLGKLVTMEAKAVFDKGLLVISVPKANNKGVFEFSFEKALK